MSLNPVPEIDLLSFTHLHHIFANELRQIEKQNARLNFKINELTVGEWAVENRVMPPGTPFEGPWQPQKTPYTEEIQENLSPSSPVEITTFIKPAQSGATAAIENKMGFTIDVDPCFLLYVTATETLGKEFSTTRLGPMLELCGLDKKLQSPKTRSTKSTGDKELSKDFPGGKILICSYNQAAMLRMTSFKVVIFDEVDTAPVSVSSEGDPRKIGEARTTAFEGRSKILITSTPKLLITSKVWAAFLEGDQRFYHVPCPDCGKLITFDLLDAAGNLMLKYDFMDGSTKRIDKKSVHYLCSKCNFKIKNHHKTSMYMSGECKWVPTNLDADPKNRSYWLNAMYLPPGMVTFEKLAQEYVDAMGSEEKMQAFWNLRAGRPWEVVGDAPTTEDVLSKRAGYRRGKALDSCMLYTCGADVHKSRLDVEIIGFDGHGTYSIEWMHYHKPAKASKGGSLYDFGQDFKNGKLPGKPRIGFIDCRYKPTEVFKICKIIEGLYACQGEETLGPGIMLREGKHDKYREEYIGVNTSYYKNRITNSLTLKIDDDDGAVPEDYPRFPSDYEPLYYDQLNSEARTKVYHPRTGRVIKYEWSLIHSLGNHALDCRVYALAAEEYYLYLVGKQLEITEQYREIVWELIKNPDKLSLVFAK